MRIKCDSESWNAKGSGHRRAECVRHPDFIFIVLNTNKMTGFLNNHVFCTSYAPYMKQLSLCSVELQQEPS